MHVWFLWTHYVTMIYSLIQYGQIVCDSIQLRSIITTDINIDVTTSYESNILGKTKLQTVV